MDVHGLCILTNVLVYIQGLSQVGNADDKKTRLNTSPCTKRNKTKQNKKRNDKTLEPTNTNPLLTDLECNLLRRWVGLAGVGQEDVLRLQVSVHDPLAEQCTHGLRCRGRKTNMIMMSINDTIKCSIKYITKKCITTSL